MWDGDLAHPERFPNPALIETIAREGIRLKAVRSTACRSGG
jgi:hypothetical protein